MARIKYYYDTETCKYERVQVSMWDLILNTAGFLFVTLIFAAALVMVYTSYFQSPREAILAKENEELVLYYELINKEMEEAQQVLSGLKERDENIYRVIFEADAIPEAIRNASSVNMNRYKDLLNTGIDREDLILSTGEKIERIRKEMYIQSKSYDEIVKLAKNKTQMLASIPAIQPMSNKELTRLASGFGMRMHPIYKVMKMHTGCDFAAPKGTPIYATGDGTVRTVETHLDGYGMEIEIDHGFGYITKYAHLEKFNVRVGQKVKRGELIGYSGNSGGSTAPHLHYEVIHDGKKVNPVHYFYHDLNPAEYEKILELAEIENQSLS